jgi:ribosomal protein S18 acetylase RimI-like enzyme
MDTNMIKMTRTLKKKIKIVTKPKDLYVDILTQNEMEALSDEIASCFKDSLFNITPESTKESFIKRRSQGKDDSLARWYVGKINGEVAGVLLIGVKPGIDTISLGQFAIKPHFRRRGIGNYMTFKALSEIQDINDKTIILYTDKNNIEAIKLYQKFGFTVSIS